MTSALTLCTVLSYQKIKTNDSLYTTRYMKMVLSIFAAHAGLKFHKPPHIKPPFPLELVLHIAKSADLPHTHEAYHYVKNWACVSKKLPYNQIKIHYLNSGHIHLRQFPVTGRSVLNLLMEIRQYSGLQRLDLDGYCFWPNDMIRLNNLIKNWQIEKRSYKNLIYQRTLPLPKSFKCLKKLELINLPLIQISPFKHLSSLTTLKLENLKITILPSLRNQVNLRKLSISRCSSLTITPSLKYCTSLKKVYLNKCKELADLPGIQSLINLEAVHIIHCPQLQNINFPAHMTVTYINQSTIFNERTLIGVVFFYLMFNSGPSDFLN